MIKEILQKQSITGGETCQDEIEGIKIKIKRAQRQE